MELPYGGGSGSSVFSGHIQSKDKLHSFDSFSHSFQSCLSSLGNVTVYTANMKSARKASNSFSLCMGPCFKAPKVPTPVASEGYTYAAKCYTHV